MAANPFAERDTEASIAELARTDDARLRAAIIEHHTGLVHALAHKFVRVGVAEEDLVQVAWVALIRSLDRFDPAHETKFSTYATHCMVGEIKRYFRDRTWGMKVPRQLQDIAVRLPRVQDALYRSLSREPDMAEMEAACAVTQEHLAEAMELRQHCQLLSLEDPFAGPEGSDGLTVADTVGGADQRLEALVADAPLHRAVAELKPRAQRIVRRRFYDGYSQQEVAGELGLSQMHVSRLERAALRQLRQALSPDQLAVA